MRKIINILLDEFNEKYLMLNSVKILSNTDLMNNT